MYLPIETTGRYLAPSIFQFSSPTGEKGKKFCNLIISPNPTSSLLTIYSPMIPEIKEVSLFDAVGRKVLIPMEKVGNRIMMRMKGLSSGTYFLHLKGKKEEYLYKVVY
jgi:hypothetical protein